MKGFNKTCQGASHIKSNKVCQDCSFSESTPELSIALVSDGHGGERYYRSHIGSELACEVSSDLIRIFVRQMPSDFFVGAPLTQYGVNGECCGQPSKKHIDALRQLGNSIIAKWREKIEAHAKENPISAEEMSMVPEEYHRDLTDKNRLAKVYGCTLIGYVQTPSYWFGFQIGDGKCFSFHQETGPKEPIMWDDACFLNKTTSLCDSYASEKIRYSFQGDGDFPFAVFLGSDGLDDSFGEDKNLINFYIQVLKLAYKSGPKNVENVLSSDLSILSKRGSQDDMSISAIYDDTKADIAIRNITEWQLSTTLGELNQNKARIHKFHKERKSLEDVKTTNTKAAIDYEYAVKEMMAAIENRKRLIQRYNDLAKELDENNPVLFNDDIPYEKVIPQPSVTITPEEPATEPKSSSEKKDSSVISQYGRLRRPRDRRGNKLKRKFFKNKIKRKNRR
ncbi:protein phosphatase 2C domain-containing protein [Bacteroides acidifaciens]|uniref:protein phosphatase 2C domain-containing protein n=1 Tax=Bacteroides acidifaciens TaxID=85831 RepID=UPI0025A9C004|nr:protein phosphatase 2C domain-containing protein [Bacteroides acidifaciens]